MPACAVVVEKHWGMAVTRRNGNTVTALAGWPAPVRSVVGGVGQGAARHPAAPEEVPT
ncbi:MAG: hypothetical protein JWM67_2911 [Mycobacterium sp.]|nr:hypothetical protein [Mycobacterium sp.]